MYDIYDLYDIAHVRGGSVLHTAYYNGRLGSRWSTAVDHDL